MELTKLSINLPESLNERWTAAAKRERRTKTAVLVLALEAYLAKSEEPRKK